MLMSKAFPRARSGFISLSTLTAPMEVTVLAVEERMLRATEWSKAGPAWIMDTDQGSVRLTTPLVRELLAFLPDESDDWKDRSVVLVARDWVDRNGEEKLRMGAEAPSEVDAPF